MEELKAAEYYEELTRKGEGAARFKQGLGFGSGSSTPTNHENNFPVRGSALPSSSSSFLSSFVRASSPSKTSEFEKEAQLKNIQSKLRKKPDREPSSARVFDRRNGDRRRSRSRSRERDSRSRRPSTSRYRDTDRDWDRDRDRRSRRSRSDSDEDRRRRRRERRRSRSVSPSARREKVEKKEKVDYSKLIEGYWKMTPAERVKAKMKFQLAETAEKDTARGTGSGWERFEFDKDAPLDDEEAEAVEDDAAIVKRIGQTFRFSTVEARRAEELKTAHDEAMFGGPSALPPNVSNDEPEVEDERPSGKHSDPEASSLVSEKVLVKQQGSWRDRVRKS